MHTFYGFQNFADFVIRQYYYAMSRVFIGIPVGDEIKREILKWQKDYAILPVRWLEDKNLHVTLVPPWQEKDVPTTLKKLESLKNRFGKINLEFENVSFGTDNRSPRLIWATGTAPVGLLDLTKEIYKALRFQVPERKLKLHTTMARFRPEDFPKFPIKKIDEKINWEMTAFKIILYKSKLRAVGADYIPLGEVYL